MFRINIRKGLIYRGQFCRSMHKPSHEHVSNDEIMSPANGQIETIVTQNRLRQIENMDFKKNGK